MLNFLHSYYKPICLTLLVLLGLSCGHLVDSILQLNLRPSTVAVKVPDSLAQKGASKPSGKDLDIILQNNLFYADGRSASAAINLSGSSVTKGQTEPTTQRVDLKLVGTVVADGDSLALIEAQRELKLYALGEEVPGGGTIEDISRNLVRIRNQNRSLTTLVLHEQGEAAPAPAATRRPEPKAASRKTGDTAGTVREVGENSWVVSRSMVESVREDFSAQLRLAQLLPRQVDGKTNGFLIKKIYPRSILGKMGLKPGDVVMNVNNLALDSPEKALQIFQQLREARQVTVDIERNSQPLSFIYEVE